MKSKRISRTWWRGFFGAVVGEVMFASRKAITEKEVKTVVKATRVRPPAAILDLACGTGRHSMALARLGFAVTGLDYSRDFLREARADARKAKLPVAFVRGDMRDLRDHFQPKRFDLVVSLFNSFGYFAKRSDDRRVLREVHRVLKPGGAFVINTLHASGVAERLRTPMERGSEPLPNVFMIDRARYDRRKEETSSEWIIVDVRRPKARILRQSFRQNVYSHAELKRMLRAAGFRVERVWGMLSGRRFQRQSWHQTILARRPMRRR
jgi:ubiquinone/menaquinone biosynthesis C-methylase UbiE